MDGALYYVIPANDTKRSVFGPTNFPRRRRGSNPGPLAQEASALTTRLPRFLVDRPGVRIQITYFLFQQYTQVSEVVC